MQWQGWLVVFCAFVFASASQAQESEDDSGWQSVKLDITSIVNFATYNYPCHKDDINNRACVELINALGSKLKPAQMLVPHGFSEDGGSIYPGMTFKVLKDFGVWNLVEVEKTETATASVKEILRRRDEQIRIQRAAVNEQNKIACLDYMALAESLVKQYAPEVDVKLALGEAMNRMAVAVDPHAHLAPLDFEAKKMGQADRSLFGIGAELSLKNGLPTIVNAMPDSPAEKSGLRADDLIVAVNGEATKGKDLNAIVKQIRGPRGTEVRLSIRRGVEELELKVIRDEVKLANLVERFVSDFGPKYQYIRMKSFIDTSACSKIRKILYSMPKDVQGVVLDLRDNGGGLLDQAVCISGLFLGPQVVVRVREVKNGVTDMKAETIRSSEWFPATTLPMTVLINSNSASASEVVSGALRDHKRAWVVGVRSFGKATVQSRGRLAFNREIAHWQTTARFYQPGDTTNQMVGISPDFEVYSLPEMNETETALMREENIVPGALSAVGEPWRQTRQEEIDRIQSQCLVKKQALAQYNARAGADLQLLTAQEVLACDSGSSTP